MDCLEAKTVPSLLNQHKIISMTCIFGGCPGVPVHGGIPIVFISIHGVLTQFVNVLFLCVPVQEDTTHFFIDNYRYNCSLLTPVYFLTKISQQTVLNEHFKLWLGCKFRTWFASISSFVDSNVFVALQQLTPSKHAQTKSDMNLSWIGHFLHRLLS